MKDKFAGIRSKHFGNFDPAGIAQAHVRAENRPVVFFHVNRAGDVRATSAAVLLGPS